ncbi:MAG TPA: metallophosphoesterase [Eubacteriales bacterium]|nr:metallophosphoesterase [Eubacteriales bacterium]
MKRRMRWLPYVTSALALVNLLIYFAIRPMWSGIIAIIGQASPYIILSVIIALAVTSVTLLLVKKRCLAFELAALILGLFFAAVEAYIMSVTIDSYRYFLREGVYVLLAYAIIALALYLVFAFPKTKAYDHKWLRVTIALVLVLAALYAHTGLIPNSFTTIPVVYAVGDEYQIVFTTKVKGTAFVMIDGKEYNALYAGSRTSEDRVLKVSVPMEALDEAKSYTICTRAMYLRGPYCALQGKTLSQEYEWKGVDTTDGINYYVISDTHTDYNAPAKAASYFGDKLDFLICCGDTANWIDRHMDACYFLKLAGKVTGGAIPVVYARGNHETKGVMADEYYKYVGSSGQSFYYTFRIQSIWGIVLDLGENHGDDWSEHFDSSRFDSYRAEQTEFLDSVIANADSEYNAEGVTYRIAVCHIPITFFYREDNAREYKEQWIERLEQMKLTVCFGGHRHQLMYIDSEIEDGAELVYYEAYAGYDGQKADGFMSNATFPNILVSRKCKVQQISSEEIYGDTEFIGLAVTVDTRTTTMRFTDVNGNVISPILSPWFSDMSYGDEIVIYNVD